MSIAYAPGYENDYVVNNRINREYSIVFERGNFNKSGDSCIIPVKNRREIELLLLTLGEEAGVIMDEQERKLCDISEWLWNRTYSDLFADLKWSYREEDEILNIIEKIPLPKTLNNSFLKIRREDPDPEPIDAEYVHKKNGQNVIISKPYKYGNMFYFNGFTKTAEFNLDHASDHLEGIVIFEAARQAGIASAHLGGLPLTGAIVILKTITRYKKFIECADPYVICTIPVIKPKGGYSIVVYNIVQNGHSCATGYITGMVYKTKESYQKFRNIKSIGRTTGETETGM